MRFFYMITVIALLSSCKNQDFLKQKYTSFKTSSKKHIVDIPLSKEEIKNKTAIAVNHLEKKENNLPEVQYDLKQGKKVAFLGFDSNKLNNSPQSFSPIPKQDFLGKRSFKKDPDDEPNKPETWALVLGFTLIILALVLLITGIVILFFDLMMGILIVGCVLLTSLIIWFWAIYL